MAAGGVASGPSAYIIRNHAVARSRRICVRRPRPGRGGVGPRLARDHVQPQRHEVGRRSRPAPARRSPRRGRRGPARARPVGRRRRHLVRRAARRPRRRRRCLPIELAATCTSRAGRCTPHRRASTATSPLPSSTPPPDAEEGSYPELKRGAELAVAAAFGGPRAVRACRNNSWAARGRGSLALVAAAAAPGRRGARARTAGPAAPVHRRKRPRGRGCSTRPSPAESGRSTSPAVPATRPWARCSEEACRVGHRRDVLSDLGGARTSSKHRASSRGRSCRSGSPQITSYRGMHAGNVDKAHGRRAALPPAGADSERHVGVASCPSTCNRRCAATSTRPGSTRTRSAPRWPPGGIASTARTTSRSPR